MTRRLTERTIDYAGELNAAQFEMILGLKTRARSVHCCYEQPPLLWKSLIIYALHFC